MTEHHVLIFAYHYPPENAAGAARPFRFSKYLSRLGYNCHIFTAAEQTGRDDPNTEYVPDPFVTNRRTSVSWQLERAVRKVFLPGETGMQWSCYAARAARAYIRAHSGAQVTVLSTFPPMGSHLAGWQLARGNRFTWIADFRDPLSNEFTDRRRILPQKLVYRWLESAIALRADAVIANTDAAAVRWQEKFPSSSNKFHVIWNGFDPEKRINALPVSCRDHRILSHVGELYHGRNATPILESIARLIAAKRISERSVRLRLIGPADADCLPSPEFIYRAQSEGWLELVNRRIPLRDALQVAQTSDGLLLLQLESADQVPAKIFDYLQIGRPILTCVQRNSPTERLLAESGVPYRCVYPSSTPEEIDDIVADYLNLPSTAVAVSSWFEQHFNAEHQARQLEAIIRSLQEEPTRETNPLPGLLLAAKQPTAHQNMAKGRRNIERGRPI